MSYDILDLIVLRVAPCGSSRETRAIRVHGRPPSKSGGSSRRLRCARGGALQQEAMPKITEPDPDDGLELDIQVGLDAARASTSVHRAAADVRIAYTAARLLRRAVTVAQEALESR